MPTPKPRILIVPIPSGVNIVIDGVTHYKKMRAHELLTLAQRLLDVGLENLHWERYAAKQATPELLRVMDGEDPKDVVG